MREIELSSNSRNEARAMRSNDSEPLKLVALDPDDLKILSAHLQDAVLRMADMAYRPTEKRFAAVLNRFDWLAAEEGQGDQSNLRRCRCALRFDRVRRAQIHKVKPGEPFEVAELLAVTYQEGEPPSGYVTLYFAGGGAIRLEVECIEAELRDLGSAWRTSVKPAHAVLEPESSPSGTDFMPKTE
jgi:hypothetical protein